MSDAVENTVEEKEEATLPAGLVFEKRYQIISSLGSGATATVYHVNDLILNRELALKLIHKSLLSNPDSIERFKNESTSGSSLSHPNLAKVYSAGIATDGRLFMAMDYLQGESLADLLRREKRLGMQSFFEIFFQIIDGLDYLHKQGVVHRDLKPSNIILLGEDKLARKVYIVDFGLAKYIYQSQSQKNTQTGELLGSSAYMSPEQCVGDKVDQRSDIYSLSCMMLECLSGSTPFQGDGPLEIMYKQINESLGKLDFLRQLPPPLAKVLSKGLQKKAEKRYQSLAELRSDLLRLSQMQDTLERQILHMEKDKTKLDFRSKAVCVFAAALVLMLAFVIFSGKNKYRSRQADSFLESQKKARIELDPPEKVRLSPNMDYISKLLEKYSTGKYAATAHPVIMKRWLDQYIQGDDANYDQKINMGRRFIDYMFRFDRYAEARPYVLRLYEKTKLAQFRYGLVSIDAHSLLAAGQPLEGLLLLDKLFQEFKAAAASQTDFLAMAQASEARGDCYQALANYGKAGDSFLEALKLRKRYLVGPEYPGYENISASKKLLYCYCKLGKQNEFEDLVQSMLVRSDANQNFFGHRSDAYLTAAQSAANAGDLPRSEFYYKKALSQKKQEKNTINIATIQYFLAEALLKQHKFDEAIQVLEEELSAISSSDTGERLAVMTRITRAKLDAGSNEAAASAAKRMMHEFETSKYNDLDYLAKTGDLTCAMALANYAATNSQVKESEAFLTKYIEHLPDCPTRAELLMQLGHCLSTERRFSESLKEYEHALAIWDSKTTPDHFKMTAADLLDRRQLVKFNMLTPLLQLQNYELALKYCEEILSSKNTNTHWMRKNILGFQASIFCAQKKYELADQNYRRLEAEALETHASAAELASCLGTYACILRTQERYKSAQTIYRRLLDLIEKAQGDKAEQLIPYQIALSEAYAQDKNLKEGIAVLNDSLQVCSHHPGSEYKSEILGRLADYCQKTNNLTAAQAYEKERLSIPEPAVSKAAGRGKE